jgi:CheY-like chemotaxis protein
MSHHLLVVDDHPVNRTLVTVLLRNSDWLCEQASGGAEALDKLRAGHFDCVLLDISMPDISGEEVCRQIRADHRHKGLRVIAYTAHTMQDDHQKILAAGFDSLLIKPISRDNLLNALAFGNNP